MHIFKKMSVKRKSGKFPVFRVKGENDRETIAFNVKTYEHSSWTFRKKLLGFLPNKLVYNEYPATVSDVCVSDRRTGTVLRMGKGVGNAEHTNGMLL